MGERIGDHLVRLGFVTWADVDDALGAKGTRLASTLVRRGKLSPDEASRALAEQHGVPAALAKHLAGRDVALAPELPAALARELVALPLAISRGTGNLVVCVRDPSAATAARLSEALGKPVTLAVCVECALTPLIAETYPAEEVLKFEDVEDVEDDPDAPNEFEVDMNSGLTHVPPGIGGGAYDVDTLQLVDLDDQGVAKDLSQIGIKEPSIPPQAQARRVSGPFAVIAEAGLELPARPAGPPPGLRAAIPPSKAEARLPLDPAVATIQRATTIDAVAEAIVGFLRHRYGVGVVFRVDNGLALCQGGFGGDLDADSITALSLPLNQPSILRATYQDCESYLGPPTETSAIQDRFFKLVGTPGTACAVLPIVCNGAVVDIVYAHGPRGIDDASAVAELQTVVRAAEQAIARITLSAKA